MGYYTEFNLIYEFKEVKFNSDATFAERLNAYSEARETILEMKEEIQEELESISGYTFEYYNDAFNINAKWYDWEKDMTELSKAYPEMVFYLSGDGENREDMWEARFYNGKCDIVYAKFVMPEFPPL